MTEPLFPIRPLVQEVTDQVFVIEPYRHDNAWVFDDARVGLLCEPFVAGISEMIDRLTTTVPNAVPGFRLLFSAAAFDGWQTTLTWLRADPVEGHWYRAEGTAEEGWLCPALFCYFPLPPPTIFIRAEPQRQSNS